MSISCSISLGTFSWLFQPKLHRSASTGIPYRWNLLYRHSLNRHASVLSAFLATFFPLPALARAMRSLFFYPFSPSGCAASDTPPLFALSQATQAHKTLGAGMHKCRPTSLAGCPASRADIDTVRQRKMPRLVLVRRWKRANPATPSVVAQKKWKSLGPNNGKQATVFVHTDAMWMDAGKSPSTHSHKCSCDKNWLALAVGARAHVCARDSRKSRSFLSSRHSEWRGECRRMANTFALSPKRVRKGKKNPCERFSTFLAPDHWPHTGETLSVRRHCGAIVNCADFKAWALAVTWICIEKVSSSHIAGLKIAPF